MSLSPFDRAGRPGDEVDPSSVLRWVRAPESGATSTTAERVGPDSTFRDTLARIALEPISDVSGAGLDDLADAARRERRRGRRLQSCLDEIASLHEVLAEALQREVENVGSGSDSRRIFDAYRRLSRRTRRMARTCATSYLEASEAQVSEVGTFDEFTRALRHELRDTLGSAFASARLLQDVGEKLPEPSRNEVLGSIPRNVQRAIDLLDGVCLLFGSESSWEDEPREKGLLEDVLPEAAENVSERERAAGVAVEVVGAIPACRVDAGRTRLILHNLVSNAVKYSDRSRDQPWVRLYVDPVEGEGGDVADEAEPGRVRIRVEDNGLGISPDEQERVFDPFYRGDAGDMSGSGLGLAIAREAARQMGGELTLESEPGRGSTFFVTVPTLRGPDEAVH